MREPIELIRVEGTHREAGLAVGAACIQHVTDAVRTSFDAPLPSGRTRAEQLDLASRYKEATERAFPEIVAECDAIAEGADAEPLEVFATAIEEIWYAPRGRCSDLVAGPRATADGRLIVGHTNDLAPATESQVVGIERRIEGRPTIFTLGVGPWPSAGWNSAGISFTGNELSPNDERIGIPRLIQFRAMLEQVTLAEVESVALRPDRASSYNNLVATKDGVVVNVEGSATDAEVTGLDERDILVHTNHYACERMLGFEGDPRYAKASAVRLERGLALLREYEGSVTVELMRRMLADHGSEPSICRHEHPGDPDTSKTVFWCVVDVSNMVVHYGRGNPCDSASQTYRFA